MNRHSLFAFASVLLLVGSVCCCIARDPQAVLVEAAADPDTLARLEFSIIKPDGVPIHWLTYSCEIYHTSIDKPIRQSNVAHQAADGVLRIPIESPTRGRIRLWVKADNDKNSAWRGYGSFSFDLKTPGQNGPRPTIKTKRISALIGRVVSAADGSPIKGAEVAPTRWGHHSNWADWDQAVKTDRDGQFRIADDDVDGLAARHEAFGEQQIEFAAEKKPSTVTFNLQTAYPLRGRVIDAQGDPIAGVKVGSQKSDKEGRFIVMATRERWKSADATVAFYGDTYEYKSVLLSAFDFDGETDITLHRELRFHGQVVDINDRPIVDAVVEVEPLSKTFVSRFRPATMLGNGRWEHYLGKYNDALAVRVTIDGTVQSVQEIEREHKGMIKTIVPSGHRIVGNIGAVSDPKHAPWIVLRASDEKVIRVAKPNRDGSFQLAGLSDDTYALEFYPEHLSMHGGSIPPDPAHEFATPIWKKQVRVQGADYKFRATSLTVNKLMPGRVEGVAVRPGADNKAHANVFIYVCDDLDRWDTVGTSYYIMTTMTDSQGRFAVDPCPPGRYALVLSDHPNNYDDSSAKVWVDVKSGKSTRAVIRGDLDQ